MNGIIKPACLSAFSTKSTAAVNVRFHQPERLLLGMYRTRAESWAPATHDPFQTTRDLLLFSMIAVTFLATSSNVAVKRLICETVAVISGP